jgi:HK97 family phage portal protein
MKIFSAIRKYIKNLSLTDPKAWDSSLWRLFGSQSASGEVVNEYTSLNYSAVWNAVSLIAGTVSSLPLHLLRSDDNRQKKAIEKPLYRVMSTKPNPFMTSKVLRETMTMHLLTWGNAYAEIVRNGYGNIAELWPIAPNRVTPKIENGAIVYNIAVGGQVVKLGRDRILHLIGPSFDGFIGYSIIALARKSIGLSMAMETFGSQYFGQGTHPGVIVSHPKSLSPTSHSNLKASLTEEYSGLGKSHRLMLLDEDMKLVNVGIPPEDSQFLESRQFQITEIARWFNLPPHKLKDLTRSSFNNIESEQISFVTDSILPWLIGIEQFYNTQLLTENEQWKENLYFKHNVEGLLRGNAEARAKYYQAMWNVGAMSINEIRGKEDMDPIEGGDDHFVPLNYVPIRKLDEVLAQGKGSKEEKPNETETQPIPA